MFKYLVERTWQKVIGWNKKLLSAAGREVLIKAVLQALPQYVMMCWKLPISLCKRLSSILTKFWWSGDGRKVIHWTGTNLLNRAKEEGGMNFRDFTLMNDAFLLKQFWRILENPTSLVSRIMKAKYFRSTDLLSSSLQSVSSPVWKGIWTAGMEVKQWICFQDSELKWLGDPNGSFSVNRGIWYLKKRMKIYCPQEGENALTISKLLLIGGPYGN